MTFLEKMQIWNLSEHTLMCTYGVQGVVETTSVSKTIGNPSKTLSIPYFINKSPS